MASFSKDKTQNFTYVYKLECDRCKKQFTEKDFIDWQECISIREVGGYGSIFGDGYQISLDLCQDCFKEICGKFINVHGL